jgi:hypothetical protein
MTTVPLHRPRYSRYNAPTLPNSGSRAPECRKPDCLIDQLTRRRSRGTIKPDWRPTSAGDQLPLD